MTKQKFIKGDLVRVAKDLGQTMSHFVADCDAIVMGSYADQFGGNDTSSYTLHLKGKGRSSWYKEHQLTLIKQNQLGLLSEWEEEEKEEAEKKSDIDWIFNNGEKVAHNAHISSLKTMASYIGIDNIWGSRGDGIDLFNNSLIVMSIAIPYLMSGDKEGFLEAAGKIKQRGKG